MADATISRRYGGRRPQAPARKMGTWKLAYADFLTALVAFFLLMWLINGVPGDERTEIANFFTDRQSSETTSLNAPDDTASHQLFSMLSLNDDLAQLGDSIILAETVNGVRIEMVDQANRNLFDSGQGELTETGHALAYLIGDLLAPLPVYLSLEGHTDAFSSATENYSNWELSSDRAHAARRTLIQAGFPQEHIKAVVGLADTTPLVPGQPHLPVNRRVTILVQFED